MENRDRDKLSKNTESTPAGDVNRQTSQSIGKKHDESGRDFGQNIGRSENLTEESGRRSPTGEGGMSGSEGSRGSVGSSEGVGSPNRSESDIDRKSGRKSGNLGEGSSDLEKE